MQLIVNSQTIAKELRLLAKIVANKPAIPILSHVLISASDALTLTTTDLEIALRTTCPVIHIGAPGVVAIPVGRLLSVIEQIPDADVTIELDKTHVKVTSGAFKSRLQAMSADDFPQMPDVEGTSSHLEGMHELIDRTRYAIAESSSKYMMQGALLVLQGPVAAMVATDGHRLALATTTAREGADDRFIIPVKTLNMLTSFDDNVEMTVSDRHLFFAAGSRLLVSRMLDGQFPSYERIIPRDGDKVAVVDRSALSAAIKRVGLVSEQNQAAYFDFNDGAVDITSSSAEVGDAAERVALVYTGAPLKICVNWSYILDFLQSASGQTVKLTFKDANSALLMEDGENYLGVAMTMRRG